MRNPSTYLLMTILSVLFFQACFGQLASVELTRHRQNRHMVKEDFQCPATGGFYPIPDECTNTYYSCIQGDAFVMTCPGSSIFDPQVGVCVPAEVASCRQVSTTPSSGSTTSRTTTTQGPLGPFTCPDQFGYYSVPGVPCSNQFYTCSNGDAYLMTCPYPTIWNAALTVCDWDYNVPGCGSAKNVRVIRH